MTGRKSSRSGTLRGALDLIVLRVLNAGPLHGYAIALKLRQLTDDELRIEEGSLYPALYRMERAGWVEASWGENENSRRVRVYELTPDGRAQLEHEIRGWRAFSRAISKVVEEA